MTTTATLTTTTSPAPSPGSVVRARGREVRGHALVALFVAIAAAVVVEVVALAHIANTAESVSGLAVIAVAAAVGAYVDTRTHTRTGLGVEAVADALTGTTGVRGRFLVLYTRAVRALVARVLSALRSVCRVLSHLVAHAPHLTTTPARLDALASVGTCEPRPMLAGSVDVLAPPRTVRAVTVANGDRKAQRVPITHREHDRET